MDVEGDREDNDIHNSLGFPGLNVTWLHDCFFYAEESLGDWKRTAMRKDGLSGIDIQ